MTYKAQMHSLECIAGIVARHVVPQMFEVVADTVSAIRPKLAESLCGEAKCFEVYPKPSAGRVSSMDCILCCLVCKPALSDSYSGVRVSVCVIWSQFWRAACVHSVWGNSLILPPQTNVWRLLQDILHTRTAAHASIVPALLENIFQVHDDWVLWTSAIFSSIQFQMWEITICALCKCRELWTLYFLQLDLSPHGQPQVQPARVT